MSFSLGAALPAGRRVSLPQSTHNTHTTLTPLMSLNTLHAPSRRIRMKDTPPTQALTQPPDPETRATSKTYFKLIQAVHHKHIIDHAIATNNFPTGMMKQVQRLTDFIKPSTPSINTREKVQDNTAAWMMTNMHILQTHYQTTISTLSTTLTDKSY